MRGGELNYDSVTRCSGRDCFYYPSGRNRLSCFPGRHLARAWCYHRRFGRGLCHSRIRQGFQGSSQETPLVFWHVGTTCREPRDLVFAPNDMDTPNSPAWCMSSVEELDYIPILSLLVLTLNI